MFKLGLSAIIMCASLYAATCPAQTIEEHYYKSGELASRETFADGTNTENRFQNEKVEVFNRRGELIFSGNRRNFGGHASVALSFHPNGGVSKIETSSAPDAGIQWYKSRYTLDEEGLVIDFWETSHDMSPTTTPAWPVMPIPKTPTLDDAPNTCAVPMAIQVSLHNRSKRTIAVRINRKFEIGEQTQMSRLAPGDSLVSAMAIHAEVFPAADELFVCEIKRTKKAKQMRIAFESLPGKNYLLTAQHKMYQYYWLED